MVSVSIGAIADGLNSNLIIRTTCDMRKMFWDLTCRLENALAPAETAKRERNLRYVCRFGLSLATSSCTLESFWYSLQFQFILFKIQQSRGFTWPKFSSGYKMRFMWLIKSFCQVWFKSIYVLLLGLPNWKSWPRWLQFLAIKASKLGYKDVLLMYYKNFETGSADFFYS